MPPNELFFSITDGLDKGYKNWRGFYINLFLLVSLFNILLLIF